MDIGNRIKSLRTQKGITQEQLAEAMHVTGQAVSKWENGQSSPDIALLPELSIYFGVTIDELFSMTDEMHMERIANMICDEKFLSQHDFDYAEKFLTDKLRRGESQADCMELLADLHNHRARGHNAIAARYAKDGLALEPERKGLHSDLCEAERGGMRDWCVSNHHALIKYYYEFLQKNPDYGAGWQWLADNLIDDGRLDEARKAAMQIKRLRPGYLYPLYMGNIEKAAGNIPLAEKYWNQMISEYPEEWCAQLSMGDCMARIERYDEAVEYYMNAMKTQNAPRYTDAPMSIAHIRAIQGRYAEAAQALDIMLKILREDWHISSGESYEEPQRERDRYMELAGKSAKQ